MKARLLFLIACIPLAAGIVSLISCGGVGGPTGSTSPGSNSATQNFLALLSPAQKNAKFIGAEACAAAACHGGASTASTSMHFASMKNRTIPTGQYATWKLTAHYQHGVTCESCHGPGSAHQAQPTATDGTPNAILTFPNIAQTAVCAQCHGQHSSEWSASAHAQVITTPMTETLTNIPLYGQSNRCFVCHGGLGRAEYTENGVDPSTMTTAQITNVCNDILNTVPNTANCSTCHNPHAKMGNLSVTGVDAQLYHSESLTSSALIGPNTTPAQYTTPNQICGECHNGRGTTATDAYLQANTSRPSVHHSNQFNSLLGVGGWEDAAGPPQRTSTHAQAPGQCATCHMGTNSTHTMTVSTDTGCVPCHSSTDATNREVALKAEIVNDLTALSNSMSNWATANLGDPQAWDYTSNITDGSKAPNQALIPIEVKRARHNYYYIVTSGDYGVHNAPYTRYLVTLAQQNLQQAGINLVSKASVAQIPMATKLAFIQGQRAQSIKNSMD